MPSFKVTIPRNDLFLSARERKPRASSDSFSCPLSQILLLCQDFDPHTRTHTTKVPKALKLNSTLAYLRSL